MSNRVFFVFIAFLAMAGCSTRPYTERPEIAEPIRASEPLIDALRTFHANHGNYPQTVQELNLEQSIANDLEKYKIKYSSHEHTTAYTVGFFPPGPIFICSRGEGWGHVFVDSRWSCSIK